MLNVCQHLFIYMRRFLVVIKCVLFSCCWLISCCIQAGLEDHINGGINIDEEAAKWNFMYISGILSTSRQNELCMVMIDKYIILNKNTEKKISTIVVDMLQENKVVEYYSMDNEQVLPDGNDDMMSSGADIIWLNSFLEIDKACEHVVVGIFTFDKGMKVMECNIKTITVINYKLDKLVGIIEDKCSVSTVFKKLLELGGCVRDVYKNSSKINDAYRTQLSCLQQAPNILPYGVASYIGDVEFENLDFEEMKMLGKKENDSETIVLECKKQDNIKHKMTNSYKCDLCDKECNSPGHLTQHMRVHTNEKKFKCEWDGCNKAFSQNCNLKDHAITHTGARPFGCDLCDKKCATQGNLKQHMRVHTNEKTFKCEWNGCNKAFSQKCNLKEHTKIHTRRWRSPFSCYLCGNTFTNKGNLQSHINRHTRTLCFSCTQCEKTYSMKGNLTQHIKKIHLKN